MHVARFTRLLKETASWGDDFSSFSYKLLKVSQMIFDTGRPKILCRQDTVVLGKSGRLLFILSDGSRDRIPVFLSFNQRFRLFVYSI